MYTNKIWLNSKQLWRCKIYLDSGDLYDDVTEEHLLDLIDILRKVEYNGEKVKLAYD